MDTISSKYIHIVTVKLQFIKTGPVFLNIGNSFKEDSFICMCVCVSVYIHIKGVCIYKRCLGVFIPKSLTLFAVYGRKWRLLARKSHPRKITFLWQFIMEKAMSFNWDVKLRSCSLWSMKMLGDFFAISCKKRVISPWSLGYIPVLITIFCLCNSHCSFRWIVEFSSLPVINYSVVLLCPV